jgi:hypothetical protein
MPFAAGGIMNPNFGILKNGTIVVGYLTEEHILNLEWVNLVQGIIWLVRNKKVCFFPGVLGEYLLIANVSWSKFVRFLCLLDYFLMFPLVLLTDSSTKLM